MEHQRQRPAPTSGPRQLAVAQKLAAQAHKGQTDALGAPYMGHVNRVAAQAETLRARHASHLNHWDVAAAAYLHDVVEDSDITFEDLEVAGISQTVLEAVEALTHVKKQPRRQYLNDLTGNPIAVVVKLADTQDNANPQRLAQVATTDPERAARLERKYVEAATRLRSALNTDSAPLTI